MKKISVILILITAGIYYTSCSKNNDLRNPDPITIDSATIMGFKDSTQLIKSITEIGIDSSGNPIDKHTIYFYYDTLNKKINFNTEYVTSPIPTPYSLVLSYNNAGLLIHIKSTDTSGTGTYDYTYDAQNVLSSQTFTDVDGSVATVHLTKTSLPSGGYSLSTKDTTVDMQVNFVNLYTLNFDAAGKITSMNDLLLPSLDDGYIDSIFYDAFGNVSKVDETHLITGNPALNYTRFEFFSRDTKGNQYSNFNNILFNGVANFPELFGNLSIGNAFSSIDNDYFYQFTKYPFLSTKVGYENPTGTGLLYVNFNSDPQYDSKNRVVKFKMYFGDYPYYSDEYDIVYYK